MTSTPSGDRPRWANLGLLGDGSVGAAAQADAQPGQVKRAATATLHAIESRLSTYHPQRMRHGRLGKRRATQ